MSTRPSDEPSPPAPGRRGGAVTRRAGRHVLVAAASVLAVVGCSSADPSGIGQASPSSSGSSTSSGTSTVPSPTVAATSATSPIGSAPDEPPARVCDSPDLLGHAQAPDGAVTVRPGQDLAALVAAGTPGTTYWLTPGVHTLSDDEYDQVVPQDGDAFIGGPGAILDGRRINNYAFGGHAEGVRISHLTVRGFGATGTNHNEGVVNHDSASGWTVESTTIADNAGAGVMIGSGNRVVGNCLRDNGQYGFNAYHVDGVREVELSGNEITGNNTDDWEERLQGCGCTGGGKFWETVGAKIVGNHVHDNRGAGLWADTNNAGFLVEGNYIADNDAEGFFYETSYNARIAANTFVRNGLVRGPENPGFPTGAVYLSEAGSDPRVPGPYGERLEVVANVFRDNWSGVIAWENADRFSGSPANTSSGTTTLVNPAATVDRCATASLVATRPYLDDCRWKTQNLLVEGNTFLLDADAVDGCSPARGCGFNGTLSNYGTYPDWSPYQGEVVARAIAFEQNNRWRANTYAGPWAFVAPAQGDVLTAAEWQAPPFGQDAGSTFEAG